MAMSRSAKGRAALEASGKKPAPSSVANDFMKADTGKKIGKLAKHVRKSSP